MKIAIIRDETSDTTSFFGQIKIKDKDYYLKFNKSGWLELEYMGDSTRVPSFLQIPSSLEKEFLSSMTMALGMNGYFASRKKKSFLQKIKESFK